MVVWFCIVVCLIDIFDSQVVVFGVVCGEDYFGWMSVQFVCDQFMGFFDLLVC